MHKEMTFRAVASSWCEAKRPVVKYSTMCTYMLTLQTHLLPYFGDMYSIAERDVQRFIVVKIGSGLAKKTVRDMVAILRAVVKYGARRGIFAFQEWYVEYPTEERAARLPLLTLEHQRVLLRYLTEAPSPHNVGVLLALCTGMRIGEVCALRWDDVDLHQKVIVVSRTAGRIYNCELHTSKRLETTPKTKNSVREIPISAHLMRVLKQLAKTSTSLYVAHNDGKPLDPRTYRNFFYRLLRQLGIPSIVFHGLRHTFATRCIESGCDYKTVSSILGHANVSTTLNLYVHTTMRQKRQCIDKMSRFVVVAE